MSAGVHPGPETRWRLRAREPVDSQPIPIHHSFPKERDGMEEGNTLSARIMGGASGPLSPSDHAILSLCLRSPEDPRDVGLLPALLSMERGESEEQEKRSRP